MMFAAVCRLHVHLSGLLWLFIHAWEKHLADLGNGLLVNELESLINSVRAHNTALTRVEHDTSHAGGGTVGLVVLGKEPLVFEGDLEGHILTLEELYFALHEIFVFSGGLLVDFLNQGEVALSASNENLTFHELDQALKDQILQEFLVLGDVELLSLDHLVLSVLVQLLNEPVDRLHLVNAGGVLVGGSLDLKLNLVLSKASFVFGGNSSLLLQDVGVFLTLEFVLALSGDLRRLLLALVADELHHGFQASLRLALVHCGFL